jgi:hypothetical protein
VAGKYAGMSGVLVSVSAPFAFPPVRLIILHLIYHCVIHGDFIALSRAMKVRNCGLVYAIHNFCERGPVAVIPCPLYALEKDVCVNHLVNKRVLQVLGWAQFEDWL